MKSWTGEDAKNDEDGKEERLKKQSTDAQLVATFGNVVCQARGFADQAAEEQSCFSERAGACNQCVPCHSNQSAEHAICGLCSGAT